MRVFHVSDQHRRPDGDRRCGRHHAPEKHLVRAEAARRDVLSHADVKRHAPAARRESFHASVPRWLGDTRSMPHTRLQRSLRATFLGMIANTLLAAVKLGVGIIGHSHALVADAVESLADLFSSVIVWRGLVVASEPADEDHPYGHGKAEPIAAAVVSTMLLLAAAGITIQAAREILQPHHAPSGFTLIVLILAVAAKEC